MDYERLTMVFCRKPKKRGLTNQVCQSVRIVHQARQGVEQGLQHRNVPGVTMADEKRGAIHGPPWWFLHAW